jgi:hypothetical protein
MGIIYMKVPKKWGSYIGRCIKSGDQSLRRFRQIWLEIYEVTNLLIILFILFLDCTTENFKCRKYGDFLKYIFLTSVN